MEKTENEIIEAIASEVQAEYQMGGLADGIYLDFATDVAKRYAAKKINELFPYNTRGRCLCGRSEWCEYCTPDSSFKRKEKQAWSMINELEKK